MRTAGLVSILIAIAAVAAAQQPVQIVPVSGLDLRVVSPSAPAPHALTPRVDAAARWQPLVRMSPQERANAELVIAANSPEAREAEALWNRGEYDAAIAALRQWVEGADERYIYVGFNWRVPIQSPGVDWGPNVRVGARDSAYLVAFDRENSTGNLLVASACLEGAQTDLVVDLSTDGGSTWAETHYGYWNGAASARDIEMIGSAGYEYLAHLLGTPPDSAFCFRFDAATGAMVWMPDSVLLKTVLATSVAGDTLDQIAITSSDDQYPGFQIYIVGGTRQHLIEAGYTWNQGSDWFLYTAWGSPLYWGGLDYCYNNSETTGGARRYVFLFCMSNSGGLLYPSLAYYDTVWHASSLPMPTPPYGATQTTGIAAWKDTVFLAYSHVTAPGVQVRCVVSYDAFSHYDREHPLTDSLNMRENVAICGRLGDGVSVAWRDYAGGRRVGYRHSDYEGTTWTTPDTLNDHELAACDRPRIQRVAPGVYGVCYIVEGTPGLGSLWFNRGDWSGIAGPRPERIVPAGLIAASRRGGVRISFMNPLAGPVTLSIFDVAGRRILTRTQRFEAGSQAFECAVPHSGSYVVVLKTAAATATTKFSAVK